MKNLSEYREDLFNVINTWTGKESRGIGLAFMESEFNETAKLSRIQTKQDLQSKLTSLVEKLQSEHTKRHSTSVVGFSFMASWSKESGLSKLIKSQILEPLNYDIATGPEMDPQIDEMIFPSLMESGLSEGCKDNLESKNDSETNSEHDTRQGIIHESGSVNSLGNKSECGSLALSQSTITQLGLEAMDFAQIERQLKSEALKFTLALTSIHEKYPEKTEAFNCELAELILRFEDNLAKQKGVDNDRIELMKIYVTQHALNNEISTLKNELNHLHSIPSQELILQLYTLKRVCKSQAETIHQLTEKNIEMNKSLKELKEIKIRQWQFNSVGGVGVFPLFGHRVGWQQSPGLKALMVPPATEELPQNTPTMATNTLKPG